MKGASVVRILLEVHGDVLVEAREALVTLLAVRTNSEGMVVGIVGFVVNEGCLEGDGQVARESIVIAPTVKELPVPVWERFGHFLTTNINVGVEVGMPHHHAGGEPEAQSNGPDVVVRRNVVEETFEGSAEGPFPDHGIRGPREQEEPPVPKGLDRENPLL